MIKAYYQDTYQKEITCKPTEATIFYPECGGQPGDRGYADDIRIVDTRKADNGDSIYVLEDGKSLDPDREYTFKLDWAHRYRYMQMHACQHMLSGLLFTMFNIGTVAVHLGEEYLTIEVSQESVPKEQIDQLVERANQVIMENHKIVYHEKSLAQAQAMGLRRSIKVDSDVRLVEIEGVDIIACGGVHVAGTSEIGMVLYYKQEIIRGHVRMFFKCGRDAFDYALKNIETTHSIEEFLGCSQQEIIPRLTKMSAELDQVSKDLKAISTEVARQQIESAAADDVLSLVISSDLDAFAKASESFENLALCAVRKNESNWQWMVILKGRFEELGFNWIKTNLFPKLNAKGGGKAPMYRGISSASDEQINEFIKDFATMVKQ